VGDIKHQSVPAPGPHSGEPHATAGCRVRSPTIRATALIEMTEAIVMIDASNSNCPAAPMRVGRLWSARENNRLWRSRSRRRAAVCAGPSRCRSQSKAGAVSSGCSKAVSRQDWFPERGRILEQAWRPTTTPDRHCTWRHAVVTRLLSAELLHEMGSARMDNHGDDIFAHPKRRGSILLSRPTTSIFRYGLVTDGNSFIRPACDFFHIEAVASLILDNA
jgi:hypothetical protein